MLSLHEVEFAGVAEVNTITMISSLGALRVKHFLAESLPASVRLIRECRLKYVRQPRLPFRHPAGIVLADGLLVVTEQTGDIGHRHSSPQKDPRERIRKRCGVGRSSNLPASSNTRLTLRRHRSVTVSSRFDTPLTNRRSPHFFASAFNWSRIQSGIQMKTSSPFLLRA